MKYLREPVVVVLLIVLVGGLGWWYWSTGYEVKLVSGAPTSYTVEINGKEHTLHPFVFQSVRMRGKSISIRPVGNTAIAASDTPIDLKKGQIVVVNPDGGAFMGVSTYMYSKGPARDEGLLAYLPVVPVQLIGEVDFVGEIPKEVKGKDGRRRTLWVRRINGSADWIEALNQWVRRDRKAYGEAVIRRAAIEPGFTAPPFRTTSEKIADEQERLKRLRESQMAPATTRAN